MHDDVIFKNNQERQCCHQKKVENVQDIAMRPEKWSKPKKNK